MTNNVRNWIRESITFKFIIIAVLTLLLLIPAAMIQSLISERETTRNQVISEVSSKWANEQLLIGPIITIPYNVSQYQNGKDVIVKKHAHFLPAELNVSGEIIPEIRYRGIYEVIVYTSRLTITGYFDQPDFSNWKLSEDQILLDETIISYGISDMRGINEAISFEINGQQYEAIPGLPTNDITYSGISSNILKLDQEQNSFKLIIDINGSQELNFIPAGKITNVKLQSNWKDPSFSGSFLPDKRTVDNKGFNAEWLVFELNRNYPQRWLNNAYQVHESEFGVSLLFGVDLYQKSERSAKYAIMFLALTFLIFILSEITNKKSIHPIQYLLIGMALCVFYTLLISLAEQIGFNWAYLTASASVVILITIYTASILKSRKVTAFVAFALIILYVFLYTILQLQDYSLLMGSIGLFIVIAITMYLSRKIDWYGTIGQDQNQ